MESDSREYDILERAVITIQGVDGLTCEIGVRKGGGTQVILDTLKNTKQDKTHIAIDPYGNIDYNLQDCIIKPGYTNKMKMQMLVDLYSYCLENDMDCIFFPMEDTEFFYRFSDGIPIYNNTKTIENRYSLVFFDGPHSVELIKNEFNFFKDKISIGGVLVFDDIDTYPHMERLDEYIKQHSFKIIEKGVCKILYQRV